MSGSDGEPTNARPTEDQSVGSVEDREEPLTLRSYPDVITDEQWEAAVQPVVNIAGGDSERGERARRAIHVLCGQPFVSGPMWAAAQAVAWNFIAAVTSGDEGLRRRANALTKQAMALAAEAQVSLTRAA